MYRTVKMKLTINIQLFQNCEPDWPFQKIVGFIEVSEKVGRVCNDFN